MTGAMLSFSAREITVGRRLSIIGESRVSYIRIRDVAKRKKPLELQFHALAAFEVAQLYGNSWKLK